jgi:D-serine deaminase-like pyridoxal phosphate-dependent protein
MPYRPKPGTPIAEIDTPALILDLDAFEHNISRMAGFFADKPTALRPHAKTHKCPQVALRQLGAGAIGITCAKVGEAEVLAQAGVRDILIANQIVGPIKIDRLTDLARQCDMIVAVDYAGNIAALSRACQRKGVSVRVLVEIDIGMNRCGVRTSDAALRLARQVVEAPGLHFAGLMGYEGHLVMVPDPDERARKVREALRLLQDARDLLADNGIATQIVSGGGTGTYDITGTCPPMTEVQVGSYVFMDAKYRQIRPEFEPALSILSTIVSRPTPERIVTDAGMKTMSREFGWPVPLDVEGLSVQSLSEEHGRLSIGHPQRVTLQPGDKLRFLPSHCCTTVNLHDDLYVARDGALVDIWPIAARGRAQ